MEIHSIIIYNVGMSHEPKVTVFTPTYNRKHTLEKLYSSLCRQTSKDFEWLIVDDGSSDGTKEVIAYWVAEGKIEIRYVFQANQGKMAAHNNGAKLAAADLFCCVDSDDYISDVAIERIILNSEKIIGNDGLAGMIAYRGKTDEERLCDEFGDGVEYTDFLELDRIGFEGDTTVVFKTEVIRQYPFPLVKGEKFIGEDIAYDRISRDYKMLVVREIWIICEYRSDGYTMNWEKLIRENPGGFALRCCQKGDFYNNPATRIKNYGWAHYYKLLKNDKDFKLNPSSRLLYNLGKPYGHLLYRKNKKKG